MTDDERHDNGWVETVKIFPEGGTAAHRFLKPRSPTNLRKNR